MKVKKIILFAICLTFLIFTSCGKKENNEQQNSNIRNTENATENQNVTKLKVDSIMYKDFENLLDTTYTTEPYYSKEEWMDNNGKLLHPYKDNEVLMTRIENILASLFMPEDVLEDASTEELLKVVCDGWFSTSVTAPGIFNSPSDYVSNTVARNQAANELVQRSDMVEIIFADYCKRNRVEGTEYSEEASIALNQLYFEEVILGSNHAFSIMDDVMKKEVLDEVSKKNDIIQNGKCYTGNVGSGFFEMIEDEKANGGSEWEIYINKMD